MNTKKISNFKVFFAIILSILSLALAQSIAILIAELLVKIGIPSLVSNLFMGFLYVSIVMVELKFTCENLLKSNLEEYKILPAKFSLKY